MTPAQPIQTQQTPPAAPPDDASAQTSAPAPDDSSMPDKSEGADEGGVNLQKAYSKINQSIVELFDGLGVRRSATIAHVAGQSMADHIQDIGKVLPTIGGVTANFLTATHTKHDPNGGATIAHSASKLRETVIPEGSEKAKAAISATKSFVSKAEALVGETPEVKLAKAQIQLISKRDGAGMSAWDLGAGLLSVPGPVIQALARAHNMVKHGEVHPGLTGPKAPQEAPGEAQGGGEPSEVQSAATAAPAATSAAAPAPAAASPAQG